MQTRREAWRIYREALPVLVIALFGGLFAGTVLGALVDRLARFPGLLVMVPVFLATRGNIYGALGGRIASGLHQGLIVPRVVIEPRVTNAVVASVVNAIGISVVIAVLSWGILQIVGRPTAALWEFLAIMLISGVLTAIVLIIGLLGLLFAGYRRGYDPDNLVGPIVTTLGDVFGMVFLLLAVAVVDGVSGVIG